MFFLASFMRRMAKRRYGDSGGDDIGNGDAFDRLAYTRLALDDDDDDLDDLDAEVARISKLGKFQRSMDDVEDLNLALK